MGCMWYVILCVPCRLPTASTQASYLGTKQENMLTSAPDSHEAWKKDVHC